MTDFAGRLAKVPPEILDAARATTWPNATLSEVLDTAEMLMRHLAGEKPSEDRRLWQPWLTARETRLILEAMDRHRPAAGRDAVALGRLQDWFRGTLNG